MRFAERSASVVDTSSVLDYSKVNREDLVHQTIYMSIPNDKNHRVEDILDRYDNPPYSIVSTTGTSDYHYITTNKEFIGNSPALIMYRCRFEEGHHVPRNTYELVINLSDLQLIINANSNFIVTYSYMRSDTDMISICSPYDIGVDKLPVTFRYNEDENGNPYVEEISEDRSDPLNKIETVVNRIEDMKEVNPVLLNILRGEHLFLKTSNLLAIPQSNAVRALVTVMDLEAEAQLLNIIKDLTGIDMEELMQFSDD